NAARGEELGGRSDGGRRRGGRGQELAARSGHWQHSGEGRGRNSRCYPFAGGLCTANRATLTCSSISPAPQRCAASWFAKNGPRSEPFEPRPLKDPNWGCHGGPPS